MTATLYSPDEVAAILGLHVRTVRGYVRDGRLPAVRIGKQYRISEQDLRAFTGADTAAESSVRVETTTIVQLSAIDRMLMDRVSTLVVAAANNASADSRRLQVHTSYDESQNSMKIIVIGDPEDAARILEMVSAVARDAASPSKGLTGDL